MMAKEEYRKQLVRMWDSLRTEFKGKSGCAGVDCNNCPFDGKVCNLATNTIFNAYKSIEIVERWTNEHPTATNSDKFKEVFGFKPTPIYCVNNNVKCENCEYFDYNDGLCDATRFWDAEYMPPKEGEE